MYISSNANRFYAAIEQNYGQASTIAAANRMIGMELAAHQSVISVRRQDKTGTRTFPGAPKDGRRQTAYQFSSYLTSWNNATAPSYGILFQAGLGAPPKSNSGLIIAQAENANHLQMTAAHGLVVGDAVSYGNEIRFVTGVPDVLTVSLNTPLSNQPPANATLSTTISYRLATVLPSVTIYDYWDPATAVSRLIAGAAVDTIEILVNGDYHEFTFIGPAADLVDSSSFVSGTAALSSFPLEPALGNFDYSIVPGHLGQVWLGMAPNEFFTLITAHVEVQNHVTVRAQEFGASYPRALVPGPRRVSTSFALFAQDDTQTTALYQAAKQRSTVSAMLQLGQQAGQLMGIYLPNVTPEIPEYNDREPRLQWEFKSNLAHGSGNDEIYIAFA